MRRIALLFRGEGQEGANRRHLPRRGRGAQPLASTVGKKCPQIRGMEVEQAEPANLFAAVAAEEIDQAVRGRDIGADRVRRAASVMSEIASPASCDGPCGMVIVV